MPCCRSTTPSRSPSSTTSTPSRGSTSRPTAIRAHEPQYTRLGHPEAALALPAARRDLGVRRLLESRRSCRTYTRQSLPLAVLGRLLEGAYGIVDVLEFHGGGAAFVRAVPSAGGLYPLEIYAVLQDVEGAADGLYHYNTFAHGLEPLRPDLLLPQFIEPLLGQPFVVQANALLVLSAVFERTLRKYGPRGYRYVLLEAGHAAQNICLLAVEHGLGALCIGGFCDTKLNGMLGLHTPTEGAVYGVALGHPQEAPPR
jgi:SagB-type dehydrogenase family enzyme